MPIALLNLALGIRKNWKLVLMGLAAAAVTLVIFLAYKNYTDLQDRVAVLTADNITLTGAVETQGKTIDAQQSAIGEWSASQDELVARFDELQQVAMQANNEVRRLNGIFARHDLTTLARERPGLIERRINSGTDAANRLLECATGSDRTDCADGD